MLIAMGRGGAAGELASSDAMDGSLREDSRRLAGPDGYTLTTLSLPATLAGPNLVLDGQHSECGRLQLQLFLKGTFPQCSYTFWGCYLSGLN